MLLKNEDIQLRYIVEDDIEDYIRWTTIETEWSEWDAPWEGCPGEEFVQTQRERLTKNPEIFYKLEIVTAEGCHIGWVSAYRIDEPGEPDEYYNKLAVGICIIPVDERKKGHGAKALTLFMAYLFENSPHSQDDGVNELCTQTWSGNTAMLRLADKIGFVEVRRTEGIREVRGKHYDALTFAISKDEFFRKYGNF